MTALTLSIALTGPNPAAGFLPRVSAPRAEECLLQHLRKGDSPRSGASSAVLAAAAGHAAPVHAAAQAGSDSRGWSARECGLPASVTVVLCARLLGQCSDGSSRQQPSGQAVTGRRASSGCCG